jgi:outer membrane lipoprotein-sorting protein
MLRKKRLVVLFLFTGTLFAQNATNIVAPIMEKTAQKYNALTAFSLDFTMNIEIDTKKIHHFNGTLLVKKEKYYLTFEDQVVANDGTMVWNYQKNTNEASIYEAADDEFMMFHPLKMLNDWEKDFNSKLIREEDFQNKKVNIVDLTPKKQSQFYKIRLFIDKTTAYIQQVAMYETNNTTLTYTVTKFQPNTEVADEKFTFHKKKYPDVQVNDMR